MNKPPPLRIIFAGTPDFAAHHLQGILDAGEHQVIAVYSQPDRPAGRGKKLTPSPVKQLALKNNIAIYQPPSLKKPETQAQLSTLNADLMVVVAYGLLLPKPVLTMPRLGCINVHASLLPRWRGAAPIQRAIEAGDKETGVVIMQMDEGLDTGDMLLHARCNITATDTSASLHDKLVEIGIPTLNKGLNLLANNNIHPIAQSERGSCYAQKISKNDTIINWNKTAAIIARQILAFNPFPVAYTTIGEDRIKIWQASANTEENSRALPGTIIAADKNGITVNCGKGTLTLQQIQLPGKKALDVASVLNARAAQFCVGTQFDLISNIDSETRC